MAKLDGTFIVFTIFFINAYYGIITELLPMVKLQRGLAYTYKGKEGKNIPHYKNTITVSDELIEKLGWSKGEELDFELDGTTLKVKPSRAILRRQLTK